MILEAATAGMMYLADATPTSPAAYINPISVVVTVADKVTNHYEEKNKPKPKLILSKEKQDKFDKMSKEDYENAMKMNELIEKLKREKDIRN